MDFIDSDDANALAFTEGDYSFIGITVALIHRIWESCLPLVQAAEIGTLLGLQLDTGERRTRLHALLFRLQLNFVTTHEYTHHVHGHTAGSTLDSRFASEITSIDENCDVETQVSELDADVYGAYHVLANLYADERAYALDLLGLDGSAPDREDKVLLACFVVAVGSFLFVRPSKVRVTNLTISEGAYAHIGQQVFTLIDARTWWAVANFREGQLQRIAPGMRADVYVMSKPNVRFSGVVDSVGFGVTPDADVVGRLGPGLPDVQRTLNWVHLASRFPVRVRVENPPPELFRVSESAVVVIRGH